MTAAVGKWGYMGKVPGRGDFLTQGVHPDVRDLFFEWCQASMAVSRDQLGDTWMDAYLTAPIWHFCSAPGTMAERGVVGTMIPSVDRVGRHFPFLVVAEYNGQSLDGWRQPDWASAMEDCILAVLDDDWQEDAWQGRLASIAPPAALSARLRWPGQPGNVMLPGAASEAEWLNALLERQAGQAVWWTQGSAFVEPAVLLTEGLPKVGQYAAMMVGQWQAHGWQQAALEGV